MTEWRITGSTDPDRVWSGPDYDSGPMPLPEVDDEPLEVVITGVEIEVASLIWLLLKVGICAVPGVLMAIILVKAWWQILQNLFS